MQFRFTKIFEKYYETFVEADTLEEAINIMEQGDVEWEDEDGELTFIKTTWASLDENGDTEDEGEV